MEGGFFNVRDHYARITIARMPSAEISKPLTSKGVARLTLSTEVIRGGQLPNAGTFHALTDAHRFEVEPATAIAGFCGWGVAACFETE